MGILCYAAAMTTIPVLTVESLLEAADRLSIDDQYDLINRLSDRLHGGSDGQVELSVEWMEEIHRRVAEVEAGEAELIPAEEVFAELRASVRDQS